MYLNIQSPTGPRGMQQGIKMFLVKKIRDIGFMNCQVFSFLSYKVILYLIEHLSGKFGWANQKPIARHVLTFAFPLVPLSGQSNLARQSL